MSVRTLYTYLDEGLFTARNIDLKRKVKFKPRKCHNTQIKDRAVFQGRMYTDFQALSSDHWTEMDTVHSSNESKKVLLTFFLKREKLFLAFLMNRCTKGAVHMDFDRLEKKHYSNAEFPRKSMSAGNRMSDTTSPCTKNCLNALV